MNMGLPRTKAVGFRSWSTNQEPADFLVLILYLQKLQVQEPTMRVCAEDVVTLGIQFRSLDQLDREVVSQVVPEGHTVRGAQKTE